MNHNSVLKLHSEVVCAPFDLWLARIAGGEIEREVHFYVGDRYWRLAEHYERLGWTKTAKRFRLQAEHHLRSRWNDTPPAVAVAMEVPRPPTFTKAIGRCFRKTPPDDAA